MLKRHKLDQILICIHTHTNTHAYIHVYILQEINLGIFIGIALKSYNVLTLTDNFQSIY